MLSELANRILAELEEAGQENPAAMLNTIIEPTGVPEELVDYQSALRQLVNAGLAAMSVELDQSGRLADAAIQVSLREIDGLSTRLRFDTTKKYWAYSRIKGPPYPATFLEIVLTDAGRKASVAILDERGYQWWRKRK